MTAPPPAETHRRDESRAQLVLVGCLGAAMGTAGVMIVLDSPIIDQPVLFAVLRGMLSFGLLAVGLYGWAREPGGRYPVLVLGVSAMFALVSLTAVDDPWLFTAGRVAVAAEVVLVVYLFLSYPDGRLHGAAERRFLALMAAGSAVFLAVSLLLSSVAPVAGPFVRCATDCPQNPVTLVDAGSAVGRAGSAGLAVWTVLSALGAALLLGRRMRDATPLERRALGPVLMWAVLVCAGYAGYVAVRLVNPDADVLKAAGLVVAVILALIPAALAAGLARGRVFAATALKRMVTGLGERPSSVGLRDVLARAFRDPSLELVFWLPGADCYVDDLGTQVALPGRAARRAVTRFNRAGEPVAAAVHDPALSADAQALEAAGGVVLLALENARLEADLRARLTELSVSRARLASVADAERRRIERDLHDGAQQELIAVAIKLGRLEELATQDPALAAALGEAGDGIESALKRIRDLAHGIYPEDLRRAGLAPALTAVAQRLPLAPAIAAPGLGRLPAEVETAVYFCCTEALQNVAKHAAPGTRVEVRLTAVDRELRFAVVDQGPGFDVRSTHDGHGITAMRDRIGALGGDVEISSARDQGTTVAGRVPLPGVSSSAESAITPTG
jgi:signal transduction histidine kinase